MKKKVKIVIPHYAKWFIDRSKVELGHKAYVVGGCVRDNLLGKTPHDWDICTSAKPEIVRTYLESCHQRVVDTGIKHGTVTAIMADGNYEITTFRVDGKYSDGRHPDDVEFVDDIVADLSRRDFTINAMAYNDEEGLIDPFGGAKDLKKKRIRCVGNPDERFREDPLRILRGMRFASTYGFKIERETAKAMMRNRELLNFVSGERIRDELCKMLCGENILEVLLKYPEIMAEIIPGLHRCIGFDQNNPYHKFNVYDHIAHAVAAYKGGDVAVKVALLLHDIGKPYVYSEDENGRGHFYGHPRMSFCIAKNEVMGRLKFDNHTRDNILDLVLYHDAELKPSRRVIKRLLSKHGSDMVRQLIQVRRADILAQTGKSHDDRLLKMVEFELLVEEIIADQECFKIKDLEIDGRDICSFGVSGPIVGQTLNHLLEAVIDERVENEHVALMKEATRYLMEVGCL